MRKQETIGNEKIVDGANLTPEITFGPNEEVMSITNYTMFNGSKDLGFYIIEKVCGVLTESSYDPEHGGFSPRPVSESRLTELDEANPNSIPYLGILGKKEDIVRGVLNKKGLSARLSWSETPQVVVPYDESVERVHERKGEPNSY